MRKAHFHLHSILFPLFLFGFMMLAPVFSLPMVSDTANAAEVTLAWDANSEQDLAGYKLYYKKGTDGSFYNGTGANEGSSPVTIHLENMTNPNSPAYVLTGLDDGLLYDFAVTAFTADGMESELSNQVNTITDALVENQMPHANAGADQTVSEGWAVFLNGTYSTDPEGSLLVYRWKQVAGPTVVLTDTENVQASFNAPDVGANGVAMSFELQVTDAAGLSHTDTCTVNVTWLNDVPTASAGPDMSAIPNELVTLDGSNSYDPDDGIAAYQWSQKQGPSVSISNPSAASPTFKVPESTTAGTSFVFELTVSDAGGLKSTDSCRINIAKPISVSSTTESQDAVSKAGETAPTTTAKEETSLPANTASNEAPIASAGPDMSAIPNELVTLDGSESYDSDGVIATYQWSQKQGPVVSLLKASTKSPKFKVPKMISEGTALVFELAVTDADGLTSKDECIVKIAIPFSIASATETQGGVSSVNTPAGAYSVEQETNGAKVPDTQTDKQNSDNNSNNSDTKADNQISDDDSTVPDMEPEKQNNENRIPGCPDVPAGSAGDEPLLGPVELAVNGFCDPDTGDYHSKTQWQVYRTDDKVCVLDTLSTSYLTAFRIPEIVLDENTAYFWRARFFDDHGAASGWSKNTSFTTAFSETDTDGNGIPDDQEVDISVDMNSDGMPDAQQAVVKSIMVPSRNEPIGLSIENAGTVTAILSLSAVDPVDSDYAPEDEEKINQLPYGLINFKLAVDQPGDTAAVTVHFSQPVSSSAKWVKYDPIQGVWLDYSAYAEFSDDLMSVTLEFVDGGFGDDDGVANGVIIDPSGLDLSTAVDSFSMEVTDSLETETAGGGGGGGGCFVTGAMAETTPGLPLSAAGIFLLFGAGLVLRFGDRKLK